MNITKTLPAIALSLLIAAPAAMATPGHGKAKGHHKKQAKSEYTRVDDREDRVNVDRMFTQLDRNRDGVISRSEFTQREYFDRVDLNRDGRVTRREAQQTFDNYRGMDRDRNGIITRSEWRGNATAFAQLDRNRDGVLSAADQYAQPAATTRLGRYDRNRDGRVTRSEWPSNDRSFRTRDRNRDGVLSGTELR